MSPQPSRRAPVVSAGWSATPVLLFDGDCAFCTSCVRWARRWVRPQVAMVPWQRADLTILAVSEERCRTSIQWVTAPGDSRESGAAVSAVLAVGRPPWPLVAGLLRLPGVRAVTDVGYRWVADNRHRLPGSTPACASDAVPPVRPLRPM